MTDKLKCYPNTNPKKRHSREVSLFNGGGEENKDHLARRREETFLRMRKREQRNKINTRKEGEQKMSLGVCGCWSRVKEF